jgi:hypothetical protein
MISVNQHGVTKPGRDEAGDGRSRDEAGDDEAGDRRSCPQSYSYRLPHQYPSTEAVSIVSTTLKPHAE